MSEYFTREELENSCISVGGTDQGYYFLYNRKNFHVEVIAHQQSVNARARHLICSAPLMYANLSTLFKALDLVLNNIEAASAQALRESQPYLAAYFTNLAESVIQMQNACITMQQTATEGPEAVSKRIEQESKKG